MAIKKYFKSDSTGIIVTSLGSLSDSVTEPTDVAAVVSVGEGFKIDSIELDQAINVYTLTASVSPEA